MKKSGERLIEGAVVGAILGVAAGLLLAPKSGKKTLKDAKNMAGDFYKYITPRIKKLKEMSEDQYSEIIDKSMQGYAKARKLTMDQQKSLMKEAKQSWKEIKKHLK